MSFPAVTPAEYKKANPDFPLTPHTSGQWCKKIKGSIRYFGPLVDPESAKTLYESEKVAWEAGVNPRTMTLLPVVDASGLSIADGLNLFLDRFQARVTMGEVSQRSYLDNKRSAKIVLRAVNRNFPIDAMQPMHWMKVEDECRKNSNATTYGGHINRILIMMKWLADNRMIKVPYYGTSMKRPSKTQKRIARNEAGKQWFDRDEIVRLLKNSRPVLKAMVLLGVNCGYGNADCSRLETRFIDFKTGWVDFPRPKTGVKRRAKLWPETLDAILSWQVIRPKITKPNLFVTRQGNLWSEEDTANCQIAKQFRQICKDAGLHVSGRGFYGLRRTCETIGGEAKDQVALDHIMGHIDDSMAGIYRQKISDDRLEFVCNHIRFWLFG